MGTVQAISVLAALLSAATQALANATQISALLTKAQAEGRDISPEEWASIVTENDAARAALADAVAA
jgi:hypothetical protein